MGGTQHQRARKYGRVIAVIGAAAVAPALALPTLNASAAILANYTPAVSPSTGSAATTGTWAVSIHDNEPLGSIDTIKTAKATFPAAFTNLSVPASVTDSSGHAWSVSRSGNTVTLTGSMGPNTTVSVPVTAKAPSTPGVYTVTTSATGGINGVLGQPWDRSGADPTITVGPGAAANISFVQQPTDVQTNTAMSPAVTVKVTDASGNTVTGYNQQVTLAAVFNPATGDATAPNWTGNTANAVNGVATFSNLVISDHGAPFIIKATSGSLSTGESNPFSVADVVTPCAPAGCQTGNTGDPARTQLNTAEGAGTNGDTLTGTIGNLSACGSNVIGDAFFFTSHDKGRSVTATVTISKDLWNAISNNGAGNPTLCFETLAADTNGKPWITDSGAPAALSADGRFFVGNAAKCKAKIAPPCWTGNKTGSGVFVGTIYSIPGADPGGIFK